MNIIECWYFTHIFFSVTKPFLGLAFIQLSPPTTLIPYKDPLEELPHLEFNQAAFQVIKNLTGHLIGPYKIHAGKSEDLCVS